MSLFAKASLSLFLGAAVSALLSPSAEAQSKSWVESRLGAQYEMQILYQTAEVLLKQGKVDGARAAMLASTDAVREALPRAHIPSYRKQFQLYDRVAPQVYKGFQFQGGEAAFKALIAEHAPKLEKAAEAMNLPPVGPRFSNLKDRIQRVLRARSALEEAAEASKAYARLAPPPDAHIKMAGSKAVTAPLRLILFGAIALEDHTKLVTPLVTQKLGELEAQTDKAVANKAIGTITALATQEIEFAGYFSKLGQEAAAEKHIAHAKAAIAEEQKIRAAQIASNRLPADAYQGKDLEELRALVKEQFLKRFPKDGVLAVRLVGKSFVAQEELFAIDEKTLALRKIRRYQWAYVAYRTPKTPEGQCSIYPLRIEQRWSGDKYGAYFTYKPLHIYGYTMLVENLEK